MRFRNNSTTTSRIRGNGIHFPLILPFPFLLQLFDPILPSFVHLFVLIYEGLFLILELLLPLTKYIENFFPYLLVSLIILLEKWMFFRFFRHSSFRDSERSVSIKRNQIFHDRRYFLLINFVYRFEEVIID